MTEQPQVQVADRPGVEGTQFVVVEHNEAPGPGGEGKLRAEVPIDALAHYAERGWSPVTEPQDVPTGGSIPDSTPTGRTGALTAPTSLPGADS